MSRVYSKILASLVLMLSVIVGQASASHAGMYDHVQMQSELEVLDNNGSGTWANIPSYSRPVVTSLKVDGNTINSPDGDASAGNFGVTVAPVNVCRSNQTPSQGSCYATPNRVSISVYYSDSGDAEADLGANRLNSSSPIELEIALNDAGPQLGWSYATGNPTHWSISNPGTTSAVLSLTLEPRDVPSINWGLHSGSEGCTRIPVEGCNVEAGDAADTLQANLLLSLDTTLDAAFKGTLFAGDDTIIGSFEAGSPSTPSFTYGVASAHNEFGGTQRTGTLSGVISDAMLTSYFGVNSSTMTSDEVSAAFPIVRTTDTTGALAATVSWTRWSAGTQGTDGWLVTISNISFSAPKYKVAQGKARPTGSAKLKSKKVKVSVKISGNAKAACKAKKTTCSVRVFKVTSGSLSSVATKKLAKSGKATVALTKAKVKAKGLVKGSKMAVQVWSKKAGKSTLVSSSIFTVS